MAYTLHIVRTEDFLRYGNEGTPDLEESKRLLTQLAEQCIGLGLQCVLLDLRGQRREGILSPHDIYTLARTFHETGFRKDHRLAILHRHRAGERPALFAMLAKHDGWNVETFDSYEDAMEWFGTSYRLE